MGEVAICAAADERGLSAARAQPSSQRQAANDVPSADQPGAIRTDQYVQRLPSVQPLEARMAYRALEQRQYVAPVLAVADQREHRIQRCEIAFEHFGSVLDT